MSEIDAPAVNRRAGLGCCCPPIECTSVAVQFPYSKSNRLGAITMKELLFMLALLAAWIVLNVWVLPKFGFRT